MRRSSWNTFLASRQYSAGPSGDFHFHEQVSKTSRGWRIRTIYSDSVPGNLEVTGASRHISDTDGEALFQLAKAREGRKS